MRSASTCCSPEYEPQLTERHSPSRPVLGQPRFSHLFQRNKTWDTPPAGFVPLQEFAQNLSTEFLDIICSKIESLIKTIANSDVQWIDVSPSNILINNKLEIKAIDFEIISDERGTSYYGLHPVFQEQAPTPRELASLLRGSLSALIQN